MTVGGGAKKNKIQIYGNQKYTIILESTISNSTYTEAVTTPKLGQIHGILFMRSTCLGSQAASQLFHVDAPS